MKLNFLGKGSAFYPVYGNTGAYFLWGNELYLIDCGETAFDRLYHKVDLSKIERVYVILTHLHADHVGSLGTLISYFYCIYERQVHIVYPEDAIVELLTLEGIDKKNYVHTKQLPENNAGVTAEAVEVVHAEDMKCYGYILSDKEDCIYYSGDAAAVPKRVLEDFTEGKILRIYQDTSTHNSPHPFHCFYGCLEQWIPAEKRHQVFCMHLDSPCEELLKEKGFQVVEIVE